MTIRTWGLTAVAIMAASLPAHAAPEGKTTIIPAPVMQPHRALYDVSLRSAKSSTGIADIHGQMFYDLQESCDAWTTTHRFVLVYDYIDNPTSQVVSEFTTTEAKDGSKFDFRARRIHDGEVQEEVAGQVARPSKPGKNFQAKYAEPKGTPNMPLDPETIFPMAHTERVITGALTGKKFISGQIFDGSDAEGPYQVSGLVLKPVSVPERKREWPKDVDKKLASLPGWRTQVAIFPLAQTEETASDYEMDVNLLENGVVTDMSIRYADFAIDQSLKALSPNPHPNCGPDNKEIKAETPPPAPAPSASTPEPAPAAPIAKLKGARS